MFKQYSLYFPLFSNSLESFYFYPEYSYIIFQMVDQASLSFLSLLKSIPSLQQFKLQPQQTSPLYFDALQLPPFLTTNLRSEHRKVKEFAGQDALIQAFYFNIMKLAFQIETEGKNYAQLVRQMLTGDSEFGAGQLEDRNLSDRQYRQFLREFMDVLQNQQISNFEQTIKYYPIVNDILLKMFRQILPVTLLLPDEADHAIAQRVLSFLSAKFEIGLQLISGCFKFVQSDIFVYVSSVKLVYLVFVDHLAYIKEVTESGSSSLIEPGLRNSKIEQQVTASKKSILSQNIPKVEKGKNFQTVINILDSNKMVASKYSNSDQRNSFECVPNKFDNIKQNFESQASQYYGDSFRPHKEQSPSFQQKRQMDRQSKKSQISNKQMSVSKLCNFEQSSRSSQASSQFSAAARKITEFRSAQKIHQTGKKPSKLVPSQMEEYKQEQYNKYSSQIYTQGKPSKLAIFSVLASNEVKQSAPVDDSAYDRFTDSQVLGVLEEEYRQQIRKIKKKYREQRTNIKNYL